MPEYKVHLEMRSTKRIIVKVDAGSDREAMDLAQEASDGGDYTSNWTRQVCDDYEVEVIEAIG